MPLASEGPAEVAMASQPGNIIEPTWSGPPDAAEGRHASQARSHSGPAVGDSGTVAKIPTPAENKK